MTFDYVFLKKREQPKQPILFCLPGQRLLKLLDGSIEADEVGGQVHKVCIVLVDKLDHARP